MFRTGARAGKKEKNQTDPSKTPTFNAVINIERMKGYGFCSSTTTTLPLAAFMNRRLSNEAVYNTADKSLLLPGSHRYPQPSMPSLHP
jgi:hypothetical protein